MNSITLSLCPVGMFSLGSTHPRALGPDISFAAKLVKRDKDFHYELYIPGSSVKGALRSATSRVAEAFGFSSCGESLSEAMQQCDVCSLFGNSGLVYPRLFVGDFVAAKPTVRHIITRVGIDDKSLTSSEHALFSTEAVAPGTIFCGEICFGDLSDKEIELLLLGLAALRLDRIGRSSMVDARIEACAFRIPPRLEGLVKELGEWLWG